MAKQTINIGASPNDGTGTPLRTAFDYTNQNFTELYTATGPSGNNIVVPGTATITGDLTVDTSTLKVDSANNRVGIGTASPTAKLQLAITGSASAITRVNSFGNDGTFGFPSLSANSTGAFFGMGVDQNSPSAGFGFFREATGWNTALAFYTNGQTGGPNIDTITERYRIDSSGIATWSNVGGVAGTAMTLNSTGLGLATAPASALSFPIGTIKAVGMTAATAHLAGNVSTLKFGINDGGADFGGIHVFNIHNGTYSSQEIGFFTGEGGVTLPTQRMRIDKTGNVGIGVTPSAWGGTFRALDIGSGCIVSQPANQTVGIFANAFGNGTNYTRKATGLAAGYDIYNGAHYWLNAASGAAASTFAFGDAKMTLAATGNLLVGTTTDIAAVRMQVWSADSNNTAYFRNSNATTPYGPSVKYTAATPNNTSSEFLYCEDSTALRVALRSNGGIANYQANNVSLSDSRMKSDIKPLGSYWNKIKSLEVVTFKYNDQTHSDDNIGLIAQQVESVAPELVDVDGFGETPVDGVPLKTIYTTDLYHASIKALQEAMSRIEALEAKLA